MNRVQIRNAVLMWHEVTYRGFAAEGSLWGDFSNKIEDDHDPTLEPYASMTRDMLAEGMDRTFKAGGDDGNGAFYIFMQHFLDRCSTAELAYESLGRKIANQIGKKMIGGPYLYPPERFLRITRRVFDMLDDLAEDFAEEGTELARMDDDEEEGAAK